ncbi:hypothetical protein J6590_099259 [Homalodisca vitripennis]|nr:hypothetical protein J6590_099259 [Homalodisca vitripennis]
MLSLFHRRESFVTDMSYGGDVSFLKLAPSSFRIICYRYELWRRHVFPQACSLFCSDQFIVSPLLCNILEPNVLRYAGDMSVAQSQVETGCDELYHDVYVDYHVTVRFALGGNCQLSMPSLVNSFVVVSIQCCKNKTPEPVKEHVTFNFVTIEGGSHVRHLAGVIQCYEASGTKLTCISKPGVGLPQPPARSC